VPEIPGGRPSQRKVRLTRSRNAVWRRHVGASSKQLHSRCSAITFLPRDCERRFLAEFFPDVANDWCWPTVAGREAIFPGAQKRKLSTPPVAPLLGSYLFFRALCFFRIS
jgi:hypothetical protein